MTARFAWIVAAIATAVAGGAVLRHGVASPPALPEFTKVRRIGRNAARNMADDWDSLFI